MQLLVVGTWPPMTEEKEEELERRTRASFHFRTGMPGRFAQLLRWRQAYAGSEESEEEGKRKRGSEEKERRKVRC